MYKLLKFFISTLVIFYLANLIEPMALNPLKGSELNSDDSDLKNLENLGEQHEVVRREIGDHLHGFKAVKGAHCHGRNRTTTPPPVTPVTTSTVASG